MKRRTIALLLAGMMLLLSGCGRRENTGVDAGAAQTSGSAEDTEQAEDEQQQAARSKTQQRRAFCACPNRCYFSPAAESDFYICFSDF